MYSKNMQQNQVLYIFYVVFFSSLCSASPIKIGVFGDINGTECQTKYPSNSIAAFNNMLAKNKLDHVISTGDSVHGECLSYSGSTPYKNVVQSMWAEYDKNFLSSALRSANLGLVLSPGNHDAPFVTANSRATFKTEDAGFKQFWLDNRSRLLVHAIELENIKDNYPYYWAYEYDKVLFIVLQSTTTSSLANGVQQKKWLQSLFNSQIGKEARAKIVFGHIPAYPVLDPSVGSKYSEVLSKEQVGKSTSALMDLLLDNNVDLMMVGHSHAPYPGELVRKTDGKKITILSMPCTHAPRKLFGKSELANRGFAYVEISDDSKITMNIRDWKSGDLIPYGYYPLTIPLKDAAIEYKKITAERYR